MQIREVYERAVSNLPPANEKRYWQRYIFLWIKYAVFEELQAEDMERTREVYRTCLKIIPHSIFTFAKVISWSFSYISVRMVEMETTRFGSCLCLINCPSFKK